MSVQPPQAQSPRFTVSENLRLAMDKLAPARDGVVPDVPALRAAQGDVSAAIVGMNEMIDSGDMFAERNGRMALEQATKGQTQLGIVVNYLAPEPGTAKPAVIYSNDQIADRLTRAADYFASAESRLWLESAPAPA